MRTINNYLDIFRIFEIHWKRQISVFRNLGARLKNMKDIILTRIFKFNGMQYCKTFWKIKSIKVGNKKLNIFFIKKSDDKLKIYENRFSNFNQKLMMMKFSVGFDNPKWNITWIVVKYIFNIMVWYNLLQKVIQY